MKIVKASMPDPYIIPADPKAGRVKDQRVDRVGQHEVIKVEDLHTWCRANPDVECGDLADMIDEVAFA